MDKLQGRHWPASQRDAYMLGFGAPVSWIEYESRRPAVSIDPAQATQIVSAEPDARVLVASGAISAVCPSRPPGPPFELILVSELARCGPPGKTP